MVKLSITASFAVVYFAAQILECNAGSWWDSMWGGGKGKGKGGGKSGEGRYRPFIVTAPPIYTPHMKPPMPYHQHHYSPRPHVFHTPSFGGHQMGGQIGGQIGGHFGGISHAASYDSNVIHGGFQSNLKQHHFPTTNYASFGQEIVTEVVQQTPRKVPSSYGSHKVPKITTGFGPIKQDDLITVETETVEEQGYSVPEVTVEETISNNDISFVQEGDDSNEVVIETVGDVHESVVGGTVDVPPPVYVPNAIPESFARSNPSQEILQNEIPAPLPMAEHGTSSTTYLDETPSAQVDVSAGEVVQTNFAPSEQIPFHGKSLDNTGSTIIIESSSTPVQQNFNQVSTSDSVFSGTSQAHVSYDTPSTGQEPIIEIVFQEEESNTYQQPQLNIDPSIFRNQDSDDVEVYFIEVSDDQDYKSIDDLDLSGALAGVKKEFPNGIPTELSETLLRSGMLGDAQIEVMDLSEALSDNTIDDSIKSTLSDTFGTASSNRPVYVRPPSKSLQRKARSKRLAPLPDSRASKSPIKDDTEGLLLPAWMLGIGKRSENAVVVDDDSVSRLKVPKTPVSHTWVRNTWKPVRD